MGPPVSRRQRRGRDRADSGDPREAPSALHAEAMDSSHHSTQESLRHDWLAAKVEHVDEGISGFRRARAKARALSLAIHLVPLGALAAVIAIGENVLPFDALWAVALAGLFIFLVVDYFVVTKVAEPLIESQRRRILDKTVDGMAWQLGVGAIGAALSREARSEESSAG